MMRRDVVYLLIGSTVHVDLLPSVIKKRFLVACYSKSDLLVPIM